MSIPGKVAVSSSTEETVRPIADFHPTLWGNHFLKSASDFKVIKQLPNQNTSLIIRDACPSICNQLSYIIVC